MTESGHLKGRGRVGAYIALGAQDGARKKGLRLDGEARLAELDRKLGR